METKTADEKSRRKNYFKMGHDDSLVPTSLMLRKT
jgi:hypothetical protein